MSYDPWGKATESGSGAVSDFTYTGHHFDRPSGLALAWWRGFDPDLGRWMSKDPIGLRGGFNLYGYVRNEPVRLTDPTGETPWGPPNPGPKPPSPPGPKPWCPADPEPEPSAGRCKQDGPSTYDPVTDRTTCNYKCPDGTGCSKSYPGVKPCEDGVECKPN